MGTDSNKIGKRKLLILLLLFICLILTCITQFLQEPEQVLSQDHVPSDAEMYASETISNDSVQNNKSGEYRGSAAFPIPDYVRKETERVAKVIQSRQNANTITFLACSDIHYYSPNNTIPNVNADKIEEAVVSMGQAMELIREQVDIDFAVMFGDMTWDYGETREEQLAEIDFVNDCLYNGFQGIPQFRMEGNHDDAYGAGNSLTAAEIFESIGVWNDGAVYGDIDTSYCYRDFENAKLRVICLNSSQYSGSAFLMDSAQVEWLKAALDLSSKGPGWKSIILSHHPLDWGKEGGVNPTEVIHSAPGLIASFHGHIHNFLTGTVTNTNLPRISIPNAGYSRENQYDEAYGINWKENTTYIKTPGTAENTSFCVITIDLAMEKIYADHYGAGYDRIIPYGDTEHTGFTVDNQLTNIHNSSPSPSASYTNLVPSATAALNKPEIYNGNGYKNGAYVSDDGTFGTDPSIVAVGYLELNAGDVIYIKGAELAQQDHVRLYMQVQNGNPYHYFLNPVISNGLWCDAAGNPGIKIEKLGDMYYKLIPVSGLIGAETVYYRMSLYGTGEDLVITHNEPIE